LAPAIVHLPAGKVSFAPIDASGSFPVQWEDGTIALMQVDRKKVHTVILIRGDQTIVDEWQRKLNEEPARGTLIEVSFGTQAFPFSGSPIQDEKIFGSFQITLGKPDPSPRNSPDAHFLFSSTHTPEIHVQQMRIKRDGKSEILINNGEPAAFFKNLLKTPKIGNRC
jgi:hypothetical protein